MMALADAHCHLDAGYFPEGADAKPTPVLMMSAFISPKLQRFVEGMGAAVLEKPFTFAKLHLSVIRLLRRAAGATTDTCGMKGVE